MIEALFREISGYPGLFLLAALCGLLVPVPEDVVVVFAGTRVHAGDVALLPTVLVVGLGVLTRDCIAYGIGRLAGATVLRHRWSIRLLGQHRLERATALVQRRGGLAVLMARFAVGIRVPLFVVAGALRVPLPQFLCWDIAGASITVSLTVGLGYAFGPPLTQGTEWLLDNTGVLIGILIVAIGWAGFRFLRNPTPQPVELEDSLSKSSGPHD